MNDTNITASILDQIPAIIEPGAAEIEDDVIISHLTKRQRQAVVLLIASWLHENENLLADVGFELAMTDGRVYIDKDEIVVVETAIDKDHVVEQVQWLEGCLDDMTIITTETLIVKLISQLNQVGWDMPQAWQVLEQLAPLPSGMSGSDWLGAHRAHWRSEELTKDTVEGQAQKPRARI